MEVFIDEISKHTDDEYIRISEQLPKSEYEYIQSKKTVNEKRASLLGWLLLKKHTGCNLKNIVRGKYGKPYIPNYFFNISHTSHFVALCVSDREVGINICDTVTTDYSYAYSFACEEEREYINYNNYRFWEIRTAKYAYGKCIGTEIKNLTNHNVLFIKNVTLMKRHTDDYVFTACELGD